MNVLLLGADGFLGRHLEIALAAGGHRVIRGVRTPCRPGDVPIDYRRDLDPAGWLPRLEGIDAVINAVGILNERQPGDFEAIHHRAPAALFAACAQAGIRRVIQISALGAERRDTPYLASKAAADDALLAGCHGGVVLRPSLVFGSDGASSRFFLALASLPLVFLPGWGEQRLRPIHVDDLAALAAALVAGPLPAERVVEAVGGAEVSYRQLLAAYRRGMGWGTAVALPLPVSLMALAARIGECFSGALLNRATWSMLNAGNTAPAATTAALLGRPPRGPEAFIAPGDAAPLRQAALAAWRLPLLRAVLACLWLWSAAVSLLWPAAGLELLGTFGLAGAGAWAVLAGASGLDALLGILTWRRPSARLWQVQLALVAAYTLLAAWAWPAGVVHPFAPLAKNLAFVAILFQLWAEEVPS